MDLKFEKVKSSGKGLFTRSHVTTKVEIDQASHILKQIAWIGNGVTIQAGVLPKDFDKPQMWNGEQLSDTPLGVYAAMNVYGHQDPSGNNVPARDFMGRSMRMNEKTFMNATIKGMKNIYKVGSTYTIKQLVEDQVKRVKRWQIKTLKTFSGRNSWRWRVEKSLHKWNPNVLRQTDTLLNSIDSDYYKNTVGDNRYKAFLRINGRINKQMEKVVSGKI